MAVVDERAVNRGKRVRLGVSRPPDRVPLPTVLDGVVLQRSYKGLDAFQRPHGLSSAEIIASFGRVLFGALGDLGIFNHGGLPSQAFVNENSLALLRIGRPLRPKARLVRAYRNESGYSPFEPHLGLKVGDYPLSFIRRPKIHARVSIFPRSCCALAKHRGC